MLQNYSLTAQPISSALFTKTHAGLLGAAGYYADYIDTIYAGAPLIGLSPEALIAQSAEETAIGNVPWTSALFIKETNPAGIGIYADGVGSPFNLTGEDKPGQTAAMIHMASMWMKVNRRGFVLIPNLLSRAKKVANDYLTRVGWLVVDSSFPPVKTIADLNIRFGQNDCVWACDPQYQANVMGWFNALYGGVIVASTKKVIGHVPQPPWIEHFQSGFNHNIGTGRSPDQARQGHILGSCVHTSQGYFLGNQQSYDDPTWGGLTDAQVGGPWDGQYDGVIEVFIDPKSKVVPWANGEIETSVPAHGDGPAYLTQFGRTDYAVNGRLRSIETTDGGNPDVDKGSPQIEMLCFYLAYVHDNEAGQTPETFKWRMSHWEFGGDHQQCPGSWIKNHEGFINDRTKAIMAAYMYGDPLNPPLAVKYPPNWKGPIVPLPPIAGQPPVTPPPVKPPVELPATWPAYDGNDKLDAGGHRFVALSRIVHTKMVTGMYATASTSKNPIKTVPANTPVAVIYMVESGGAIYYVTKDGYRTQMSQYVEQFTYARKGVGGA